MNGNDSGNYTCDLESFHKNYALIHGWLSLIVCVFGSVANVLNILVLTRREIRSPTNMILTGLAVADLLVMVEYIPYTIHTNLYHRSKKDTYTYGWALFVLFHSNFGQVCHTISIWLTLTLAIWRYVAVAFPQKNRQWCSYERTIIAIVAAYVLCPILCLPVYITTEVKEHIVLLDSKGMSFNHNNAITSQNGSTLGPSLEGATNTSLYFVRLTETAQTHDILKELNFWIYSVVIKLIPCFILTLLSMKLLLVLVEAKKRRKKLTKQDVNFEESRKRSCRQVDKERQTDRTTMMLLAVLLLFLLTELPQGVLGLLSVLLGHGFFHTCYVMLGDVIDILTLVNSAINFILYCSMSRQFRLTFSELFCKKIKPPKRWRAQNFMENNGHTGANHTVTVVTQV